MGGGGGQNYFQWRAEPHEETSLDDSFTSTRSLFSDDCESGPRDGSGVASSAGSEGTDACVFEVRLDAGSKGLLNATGVSSELVFFSPVPCRCAPLS